MGAYNSKSSLARLQPYELPIFSTVALGVMPYLDKSILRRIVINDSAAALGIQFWVAFYAGPTMLKHLERETFVSIQSQLFPRLSCIHVCISWLTLGAHFFRSETMDWTSWQTLVILANVSLSELNHFILFPKQIALLEKEKEEQDEAKKKQIKKKFGLIHGSSMVIYFGSMILNEILCNAY